MAQSTVKGKERKGKEREGKERKRKGSYFLFVAFVLMFSVTGENDYQF